MFENESETYSNNWKINKNTDLNFAELVEHNPRFKITFEPIEE